MPTTTLKKTDHERIQLLRSRIDRLADGLSTCHLFPQRPKLHFHPLEDRCGGCADGLLVHKSVRKSVATLAVGEFQAVETQKRCKHCLAIYRSGELRALTPQGGKFGFDVIEYVGRALFIGCRAEPQIRSELAASPLKKMDPPMLRLYDPLQVQRPAYPPPVEGVSEGK